MRGAQSLLREAQAQPVSVTLHTAGSKLEAGRGWGETDTGPLDPREQGLSGRGVLLVIPGETHHP